MPAERNRGLKRTASEGNQLVWSLPIEPTNPAEFAFTETMTPTTYYDGPPPLVDAPPTEFILFPPVHEECPAPRRQPHSKKKPDNHIPRPPNAFILFRSSFIKGQHVSTEVETNHSTLSKIIGLTWQNLPEEERQVWHAKAKTALDEHKRKFPKYAFRPTQTKAKGGGGPGSGEKRKVREVEPKDLKRCAKIAELLVEGKKGHELDAAIQEFDKHHVPEVVTRFEAPITARAYRRSSSAPVQDTESMKAGQGFFSVITTTNEQRKKVRASSSRPTRCSTPTSVAPSTFEGEASAPIDHVAPLPSPLKIDPAFDFSAFSFDSITSPPPQFDCDPLSYQSYASSPCSEFSPSPQYSPIPQYASPSLSINTSFTTSYTQQEWSSSSPTTPSTPELEFDYHLSTPLSTPSSSPSYASSFDGIFDDKSYDVFQAYESQPVMHMDMDMAIMGAESYITPTESNCNDAFVSGCGSYGNNNAHFTSFTQHHPEAPLAQPDDEFSAFMMSSMPVYSM
ncbi:hypothetical protein BDQ12DRAFT_726063 [Crucibulum laeve]|uniref:HMG box domain-containing protein n=1 Tax=Crucibulum laeve TaxID=68775 RepID=A0A5C3LSG5_9AGAR|nr:hypothetical protein BDQ12DRAFT_726063 [Crucibulum laeve]